MEKWDLTEEWLLWEHGGIRETLLESGAVSSKIAQIFIVDLIYTQVVKEMQIDAVSRKIKTTEAIYK